MDVDGTASSQVIDAGKQASNVLLNQGTLGALVILETIAIGILIWMIYKSKNAHISDKDKMSGVLNDHSLQSQGLLKDTKSAIDNVVREMQLLQQLIKDIDKSVDSLSKDNISLKNSGEEVRGALDILSSQWEKWKLSSQKQRSG